MVRGTFSPARAWRPAVVARLARTLGRAATQTSAAWRAPDPPFMPRAPDTSSRRCLRTRRETSIKERSLVARPLRAASVPDHGHAVPDDALLRLTCNPADAPAPSQDSPRRRSSCRSQPAATYRPSLRTLKLTAYLRSGRVQSIHRSTSARARPNPSLKGGPATASTAWPYCGTQCIIAVRPSGARLRGPP